MSVIITVGGWLLLVCDAIVLLAGTAFVVVVAAGETRDRWHRMRGTFTVRNYRLMAATLEQIVNVRDVYAETGDYPTGTVNDATLFDDWAADMAERALTEVGWQ